MSETTWVRRWDYEISSTPVRPGIYRLRGGGFLVRVLVSDATGKRKERKQALPEAGLVEAMRVRLELADETKRPKHAPSVMPRWSVYATALYERKVLRGDIRSAAGKAKWKKIIEKHLDPAFGTLRLDELTPTLVHTWLDEQSAQVRDGKAKPSSVNTRLAILKTIVAAAVVEHSLPKDPLAGVSGLSTDEHPTYTEEEPNALTLDEVPRFLDHVREDWPQFYAMILLGFVTAQRPSHIAPLRRRGPESDVLWDESAILFRRSHTVGKEAMNNVKNKRRQKVALSPEILEVLKWHVATQLQTPHQEASDLLFPSKVGTMRYSSSLHPVFVDVANKMKLGKKISPRAMRRTFQDIARSAGVHDLVVRSISGHSSAQMQQHYSTVATEEQRAGMAQVVQLATRRTGGPDLVPPIVRGQRVGG